MFFSKGGSPHRYPYKNKWHESCAYHEKVEANYICFDCHNRLLCVKCVNSKEHKDHQIKNITKGFEYLSEQIPLSILETNEKIERILIWERRLEQSKVIF
mgnify:CR=1 FL=1